MPELPEIEVIRQGISPYVVGKAIRSVSVHSTHFRHPIAADLATILPGQTIASSERRGKYLLLHCSAGSVLIFLGMTGYLRILPDDAIAGKHDHFEMFLEGRMVLRLNDVRRFGTVMWLGNDPLNHKFLSGLGMEPLTDSFDSDYFYQKSRSSKLTVKQFLMKQKVIAGIGNIYANEILFHAGILPHAPVRQLSQSRCHQLVSSVKCVLTTAISHGGTMLDFRDGMERSGYFPQLFSVYNRKNLPCKMCENPIQYQRLGERSIYYCESCQT